MLVHLQIRNLAIVEHLELNLTSGMSAVTGETGAGKSIMVDAIGLLLGDRADTSVVRHGAQRAEINAVFQLEQLAAAKDWLNQRDLYLEEEDCHLRRMISPGGRSRAYINGTPQPLQALRELGELLVDIHGQHEHQSLLKRDLQRQLLDDYADNSSLLKKTTEHFRTCEELRHRLETLNQADAERDARVDLLRYQIQELQALDLQADELPALEEEHVRLANAGRLLETGQQALNRLYEDEGLSVHGLLSRTQQDLENLCTLDNRLSPSSELLHNALIQVHEASDELRHYLQGVELDPQRLEWIEQRLADSQRLARKHRLTVEQLPTLLPRLQTELEMLDQSEQQQEELTQQLEQHWQKYQQQARILSDKRASAARELSERISEAMQGLGMIGGRFAITLQPRDKPAASGLEKVEFMVSANPGQPLRPLTKVASGGELSRISLAIQVIAARSARIATLIFDEVDSGIGGGVAQVVGQQLRTLGQARQVLCVTHLPQVAAQAHAHLKVQKQTDGQTTQTLIKVLKKKQRVQEIARMLGGLELTENTLAHAREMLTQAGET